MTGVQTCALPISAGKGVTVCDSVEQALQAIEDAMVNNHFGPAGARVVIANAQPTPYDGIAAAISRVRLGELLPPLVAAVGG